MQESFGTIIRHTTIFILLCLTCLTGCRKVDTIHLLKIDDHFILVFPEKSNQIAFSDLQIKRKSCDNNCIYWELVTDENSLDSPKYKTPSEGRIVYGEVPEGMKEKTSAKQLTPGQYLAGGTLIQASGQGRLFFIDFELIRSATGKLELK